MVWFSMLSIEKRDHKHHIKNEEGRQTEIFKLK